MPLNLANQRCFNHANREAVARCPECRRFFCRECITEHEDRVLCASCIAKTTKRMKIPRSTLAGIAALFQIITALVVLWICFVMIGQGLLGLPSSFHEGEVWQVEQWAE